MQLAELIKSEVGQTTIEAAYLLPLTLVLILLLLQPAILLYNKTIISMAASEGCRLLATRPLGRDDQKYSGYIKRRLAAIPPVDIFHVHSPCSWLIELEGNETSDKLSVVIKNRVAPLPLVGLLWTNLLPSDKNGHLEQVVSISTSGRPDWVARNSFVTYELAQQ